jgi:hypothetical protein
MAAFRIWRKMQSMSKDVRNPNNSKPGSDSPPWAECDYFCIHGYAGNRTPCGWRGRRCDALHDESGLNLICPRCGCATLLGIPHS